MSKSLYFMQGLELANILEHMFCGSDAVKQFVSKNPQKVSFSFKSVLKLKL